MFHICNINGSHNINNIIESFVESINIKRTDRVLVKPNLVSLEGYPYTTDIYIINTIIKQLRKLGVYNITLGDGPCPDQGVVFDKTYENKALEVQAIRDFHSGLRNTKSFSDEYNFYMSHEQSINAYLRFFFKQLNSNFELYPEVSFTDLFSAENGIPIYSVELSDYGILKHLDLSHFDVIINLPVLKQHTTVGFTATVKNFYGIITPFCKVSIHKYKKVGAILEYLSKYLREFNIYSLLDCRNIPDAQRPIWGDLRIVKTNYIIYGDDIIQIDNEAKKILESYGLKKGGSDEHYVNFIQGKC